MLVVESTYEWHPTTDLDERWEFTGDDAAEQAAQRYESEAITENQPLAQIVEELGFEKLRLESLDTETGKKVVAYELVEAVG